MRNPPGDRVIAYHEIPRVAEFSHAELLTMGVAAGEVFAQLLGVERRLSRRRHEDNSGAWKAAPPIG